MPAMPLMIDATPLKAQLLALEIARDAMLNGLDDMTNDDPEIADMAVNLAEMASEAYQSASNTLIKLVQQLVVEAEAAAQVTDGA